MKIIVLLCFSLILISCISEINQNDITIENGFYVNVKSGDRLDGKYITVYKDANQFEHRTERLFNNGVPTGNWVSRLNYESEIYRNGKYINDPQLLKIINELTQSKRCFINYEYSSTGDYIEVDLIYPIVTNENTIDSIPKLFLKKYVNGNFPLTVRINRFNKNKLTFLSRVQFD